MVPLLFVTSQKATFSLWGEIMAKFELRTVEVLNIH